GAVAVSVGPDPRRRALRLVPHRPRPGDADALRVARDALAGLAGRCPRASRRRLQVVDQVTALVRPRQARRHQGGTGDEPLRVGKERVEGLPGPDHVAAKPGLDHGRREVEARQASRPTAEDTTKVRTRKIALLGFDRMAGIAALEDPLAP